MKQIRSFSFAKYFLLFIVIQHCFHLASTETEEVEFVGDGEPIGLTPEELKANRETALKWHNIFRSWHNAKPMTLDNRLNKDAQNYANEILFLGGLPHAKDIEDGENLWGLNGRDKKPAEKATRGWYGEFCGIKGHPRDPLASLNHFTQVIWNDSIRLGIGVAVKKGATVVVGRYSDGGNHKNDSRRKDNIFPLVCEESQVCDCEKLWKTLSETDQCVKGIKGKVSEVACKVSSLKGSLFMVIFSVLFGAVLARAAV